MSATCVRPHSGRRLHWTKASSAEEADEVWSKIPQQRESKVSLSRALDSHNLYQLALRRSTNFLRGWGTCVTSLQRCTILHEDHFVADRPQTIDRDFNNVAIIQAAIRVPSHSLWGSGHDDAALSKRATVRTKSNQLFARPNHLRG